LIVQHASAPSATAYAIRTNGNIQINSWIEAGNATAARHQNVMMGHDLALAGHPGFDFGSGDGLVIGPKTGAGSGQSFQVDASSGTARVGVYTTGAPADRYTEINGTNGSISLNGGSINTNYIDEGGSATYSISVTHTGAAGGGSQGGAARFRIPAGTSATAAPTVSIERESPATGTYPTLSVSATATNDVNSVIEVSHAGQGAATGVNIQFDNVNNQSRAIVVDNGHTVLSFASLNTTADLQNATTSVVEWTGGNIAAANLPQNAINGQLLYISGNGAQDITDDSAQTVAGFWGVSLVYSGGGWRIVGFLN
jgi:hypothetical protein